MITDLERTTLRRVLELMAELDELDFGAPHASANGARKRSEARRKDLLKSLRRHVAALTQRGAPAWLTKLKGSVQLDDSELVLLLGLLYRRIAAPSPIATGRELVRLLGDSPSDLLEHAAFLHPGSHLLKSGLVESRIRTPEQALDAPFRLAERSFQRAYRAFHGLRSKRRSAKAEGFATALEHLHALREIVQLHERRAGLLFPQSLWADMHPDPLERPTDLTDAIQEARDQLHRREAATSAKVRLPVLELRRERELSDEEEIIIVELFFRELFSSAGLLEAADLIRLVSANESEALLRRKILAPDSRLVASTLVGLEIEIDEKPLMALTYLRGWVSERLIEGADFLGALSASDRARFRDYLTRLDNSGDFFRNL